MAEFSMIERLKGCACCGVLRMIHVDEHVLQVLRDVVKRLKENVVNCVRKGKTAS
jgi:hypothetical protein